MIRLAWSLDALSALDGDAPSRVVLNGWETKSLGYVWGVTETRSRCTSRHEAAWSEYLRRAMWRVSEQYADAARSSLRFMRVFGE